MENASHGYDSKTVKEMVEEQQKKGWIFSSPGLMLGLMLMPWKTPTSSAFPIGSR